MILDKYNSQQFDEKYDKGKYICCNCGQPTTLGNSASSKGYHLICYRCKIKLEMLLDCTNVITMLQNAGEKERIKILNNEKK